MIFTESTCVLWMWWGCFGLASAVGLEAAARYRLIQQSNRTAKAIETRLSNELRGGRSAHDECCTSPQLIAPESPMTP